MTLTLSKKSMGSTSIPLPPPAKSSRNWLELPAELTASILVRVGQIDMLLSARKVCKIWRRICSDPEIWRVIYLRYSYDLFNIDVEKIARIAVDLSCGQLIEFNLNHSGDDDLLNYISDRSSQLRRLYLASCSNIMNEGLSEMVKKLPLDELHLYCIRISKQSIEVSGRCCPRLKTFGLNYQGYRDPHFGCDEKALAIAENMPGLRHLQLFGNRITRDGLLAILEKCPHLESVDIQHCFEAANLGPDLIRRLSQQMKYLRLPYDSTEDCEFNEIHDLDSSDYDDSSEQSDIDIVSDDYDYYDNRYDYNKFFRWQGPNF